MRKVFSLIVASFITSSFFVSVQAIKDNDGNKTLKDSATNSELILTEAHFPWDDPEYITPVAGITHYGQTNVDTINNYTKSFVTNDEWVVMSSDVLDINNVTIDGRSCGEISVKSGMALDREKYILPNQINGISICRISDYGFSGQQIPRYLRIDAKIIEIGEGAFKLSKFDYIALPNSIKLIDDEAFMFAHMNVWIMPKNLEVLGKKAFAYPEQTDDAGCSNRNIHHHFASFKETKLRKISDEAFTCNLNTRTIEIPFGVEEIGAKAFKNGYPSGIVIPASVNKIGASALEVMDWSWPDKSKRTGGINFRWRDKPQLPDDAPTWFGASYDGLKSKIKFAYYNVNDAFDTAPLYYATEQESTSIFSKELVDVNKVNKNIILPSIINNYLSKSYEITWTSSNNDSLSITNPLASVDSSGYATHVNDGLATITRDMYLWKEVTLTGEFIHAETDDVVKKEFLLKIEPISGLPESDSDNGVDESNPTKPNVCDKVGECGMNWYVVGGIGGALAIALYLELKKKYDEHHDHHEH